MWLAFCVVVGVVATEGALHPGRKPLSESDWTAVRDVAARNHAELKEVSVDAQDGVKLRAWSLRPAAANGDAVMLLHGQSDNRAGMLGNAGLLLRNGFAVLLPDARAHGESGGAVATYGVFEADDVRRWFDWVEQAEHPRCIDGVGESMGAADLLVSLTVERGFCAVVAESVFSTFRDAGYERLGQEMHAGPRLARIVLGPAVEFGFVYARWRYKVDLAQASPLWGVEASTTPVLLIHGLRDTNMPAWHSERIKAANPAVELWEPRDAGHCGASGAAPEEYERRVAAWFAGHDSHGMRVRARR
jgi:hypothetical protein